MAKKRGTSGKGGNIIQMLLVALTVVVLSALSFQYGMKYMRKAKVAELFVSITELHNKISEERSNGKRWRREDWDLSRYFTPVVKQMVFAPSGVLMVQFNASVREYSDRWLFFVPAIHGNSTQFSYLDMSAADYDMTRAMFWLCGIPQKNGVPINELETTCRNTLGPEYQAPE